MKNIFENPLDWENVNIQIFFKQGKLLFNINRLLEYNDFEGHLYVTMWYFASALFSLRASRLKLSYLLECIYGGAIKY